MQLKLVLQYEKTFCQYMENNIHQLHYKEKRVKNRTTYVDK